MNITMDFPDTPEQFLDMYGFTDTEEYYTNGQRCITLHRVGQMLEHYFAERTCELEINIDMTAVVCSRCGYEMPKGTKLHEVNYCLNCGAKVATKDFSLCNEAEVVEE